MSAAYHRPTRPGWTCAICDDTPWPCPPARAELRERHPTRGELAQTMLEFVQDAAVDLPAATPEQLWKQLVGWTEHDPI